MNAPLWILRYVTMFICGVGTTNGVINGRYWSAALCSVIAVVGIWGYVVLDARDAS